MSDSKIQRNEMVSKESFDLVVGAQRRAAYDAGYGQALADVMAAAVFIAEDALRNTPDGEASRAVLYRFIASLETQTRKLASGEDEVSDGAGI
ncbi:MAG: hypothetical protein JWM57_693 [Phycisphaerales bacterium]|nr:hypothetical protein [Phycisphaerales bacterium]